MSAGFSPGPWEVHQDGQIWAPEHPVAEKITTGPWGDEGVDIFTGKEYLVHWWGTVATEEAKANANLIAAAPDGYSFAQAFLDYIDRSDLGDLDFGRGLQSSGLIEQARAFTAKARGETPTHNEAEG